MSGPASVLITGAGGYLGRMTVALLAAEPRGLKRIVATDVRLPKEDDRLPGVDYLEADVRDPGLAKVLAENKIEAVIHLAAIVTPGRKADRELEYSVDVLGTENVLESCRKARVSRIIVTSSGAAYGYHPDNPDWLTETDPLRGNQEFAYSDHKRQVEEMLARWQKEHPDLGQLILRPGTILGRTARNQITDLFQAKRIIGLKGAATPFVFIWDRDVVRIIAQGLFQGRTGIYNLAGDGVLTMKEIAGLLGKPYLELPVGLVRAGLWVLKKLRLTQYGPEQVSFLRYRPVLSNRRLKEEFGYTPLKTSRETFLYFLETRGLGS